MRGIDARWSSKMCVQITVESMIHDSYFCFLFSVLLRKIFAYYWFSRIIFPTQIKSFYIAFLYALIAWKHGEYFRNNWNEHETKLSKEHTISRRKMIIVILHVSLQGNICHLLTELPLLLEWHFSSLPIDRTGNKELYFFSSFLTLMVIFLILTNHSLFVDQASNLLLVEIYKCLY